MMVGKPVIRYIHEGKAAYPDVRAFRDYFTGPYETFENSPSEAAAAPDLSQSVCWYMMGFYPRRLPAALTIHDYRSLSVGSLRRTKDRIKRLLNAKPDIRIFQNPEIRKALGFKEDDRTYYLPMGVPRAFIAKRTLEVEATKDFIYIGSMLGERRCELMLDSFLNRFGSSRTFDLYGPPNFELQARYQGQLNIAFHGLMPQEQLPAILKRARVGVCYFPMHYPHVLQTPTKLMEYAALGMRIVANEHPQSRVTSNQYGIRCEWGQTGDMFARVTDTLDWTDNMATDPEPMAWPSVIANSGVEEGIIRLLALR